MSKIDVTAVIKELSGVNNEPQIVDEVLIRKGLADAITKFYALCKAYQFDYTRLDDAVVDITNTVTAPMRTYKEDVASHPLLSWVNDVSNLTSQINTLPIVLEQEIGVSLPDAIKNFQTRFADSPKALSLLRSTVVDYQDHEDFYRERIPTDSSGNTYLHNSVGGRFSAQGGSGNRAHRMNGNLVDVAPGNHENYLFRDMMRIDNWDDLPNIPLRLISAWCHRTGNNQGLSYMMEIASSTSVDWRWMGAWNYTDVSNLYGTGTGIAAYLYDANPTKYPNTYEGFEIMKADWLQLVGEMYTDFEYLWDLITVVKDWKPTKELGIKTVVMLRKIRIIYNFYLTTFVVDSGLSSDARTFLDSL